MKNRRKAVQPFEIKKRKIDIFRNYEANGFEKNQRKFENFSTLISKKSIPETNQLLSEQAQFGISNSQIKQFVDWVSSHKPEIILMESTGVYWISPYEAL